MIELKAGVIRTPHDEGMSFERNSDHVSVTGADIHYCPMCGRKLSEDK